MAKPQLDTILVKSPHRREIYSEDEIQQFAGCADPGTGPFYFMDNFFWIQHPVRGKMLYHPFDYQQRLIETYHNYRYSINLMPRQSGKCLAATSTLNIKNNKTGKTYQVPISVFHEVVKATNENTDVPDLSEFEIKDS